MLGVALLQILAAVVATFYAAHAAMSVGRDLRNDIFSRVTDVLRTGGFQLRRRVADHPQHQRRPASPDASDDKHQQCW